MKSKVYPSACAWCRRELERTAPSPAPGRDASSEPRGYGPVVQSGSRRADARYCGVRCRQAAFRLRRRRQTDAAADRPMRFAYADPPYPGRAARYYAREPTYAGEVDHRALIASLEAYGDGWALSTAADALRDVLPLCPPGARVCAWVKPIGASPLTYGIHNCWEPLIVVRGRRRRPGVRDWLRAQPARFGGELPGRKPLAFCAWLFDCLGMAPGDELVDMFPGTGVVGRAWASLGAVPDASQEYSDDTSPPAPADGGSPVAEDLDDASLTPAWATAAGAHQ